jgi:hypothetical protein
MSSISDSAASTTNQYAPKEGDGPVFADLKSAFELTVSDASSFVNQTKKNWQTRYCVWSGQSLDGKKHAREGQNPAPVPWDGASDLRVPLIDQAINDKVAADCLGFRKANLVAVPVEGNDVKRAKIVSGFMKWLLFTQVPEVDREVELLRNYVHEKGVGVMGVFWETDIQKTLETLTLEALLQAVPNVQAALTEPALEPDFIDLLRQAYPGTSKKKAKKMIEELKTEGKTTVCVNGAERQRPVLRALSLDEDVFVHPSVTDIENAPAIYRVQYYTPQTLRMKVATEGWDSAWVENAIESQRNKVATILPDANPNPTTRDYTTQDMKQRVTDLVGVIFAYQKLSDEDGVPGIFCTVFNPMVAPTEKHKGYAKFELLGYRHGEYPFVLFRREFLSRRILDTRGLPEPGRAFQDQLKACRDSRIDAASLSVCPPLMYPHGRPPASWGPGARVPERRPGEYHFGDRPAFDMNTTEVERGIIQSWKEYIGEATGDSDAGKAAMKSQWEVGRFLAQFSKVSRQIWSLYQQYGDDRQWFRVIGLRDAQQFQKGDANEQFDFYFSYDAVMNDVENMSAKLETMAKVISTFDRNGNVDFNEALQFAMETIDPTIAERIIQPAEQATQKAVEDEQSALAQIFAGIDKDIKLGAPPQVGMSIINGYAQQPEIQARMHGDKAFAGRLEKRAKQYQFQMEQQKNAQIGRMGA